MTTFRKQPDKVKEKIARKQRLNGALKTRTIRKRFFEAMRIFELESPINWNGRSIHLVELSRHAKVHKATIFGPAFKSFKMHIVDPWIKRHQAPAPPNSPLHNGNKVAELNALIRDLRQVNRSVELELQQKEADYEELIAERNDLLKKLRELQARIATARVVPLSL